MRSSVNLYKDAKVVEEKKSQALLKKIDKKNQKEKEQEKKLRIKRQFEELKNEKKTIKEDDNEEDWEDEDGIRLNELINNLKLEDDLDNHVNVDQRQVEDFLSELDKIKISKWYIFILFMLQKFNIFIYVTLQIFSPNANLP